MDNDNNSSCHLFSMDATGVALSWLEVCASITVSQWIQVDMVSVSCPENTVTYWISVIDFARHSLFDTSQAVSDPLIYFTVFAPRRREELNLTTLKESQAGLTWVRLHRGRQQSFHFGFILKAFWTSVMFATCRYPGEAGGFFPSSFLSEESKEVSLVKICVKAQRRWAAPV